jgi:hypothetical protein
MARWPKRVWVVEAIDRTLPDANRPSGVGEVVFDPTSALENQDPLMVRSGSQFATFDASANEWDIDDVRSRHCLPWIDGSSEPSRSRTSLTLRSHDYGYWPHAGLES